MHTHIFKTQFKHDKMFTLIKSWYSVTSLSVNVLKYFCNKKTAKALKVEALAMIA